MNISIEPADFLTDEFRQALEAALAKALPPVVSKLAATQPERLLLTADAAARALSMSRRSLDNLTAKGEIPVIRATSRPQFSPADLQEWIDSKKQREGDNE